MSARLLIPATALLLMLAAGACGDRCEGVVCGPVPPALQVMVTDTATIDTQLVFPTTDPAVFDTVDTMLVVRRYTTNATVTLWRVRGTDTVIADTIVPDATGYTIQNLADLPADSFLIQARRDVRTPMKTPALGVRTVGGCCSYSVVGFYQLHLPVQ